MGIASVGCVGRYVRFVALGDSSTVGLGDVDPKTGGWRGWARLLADALAVEHEVSFCNLAVTGATTTDVWCRQVPEARDHRPDLAALVVGVNDTFRSSWNVDRVHDHVLRSAAELHGVGATLLTVRFHDHGAVFGLPGVLRRPLMRRLDVLNAAYDEVQRRYGGVQVDLAAEACVLDRNAWYVDRLHPSEVGHRVLATAFADRLTGIGLPCPPPSAILDGPVPDAWRDVWWTLRQGAPWVGRRARDLAPWAVRMAWSELVTRPQGRVGVPQ